MFTLETDEDELVVGAATAAIDALGRHAYGAEVGWAASRGRPDWQVSSGVPWDYVYQYITWGWESWGPTFVTRFVNQAWGKKPMCSVLVTML